MSQQGNSVNRDHTLARVLSKRSLSLKSEIIKGNLLGRGISITTSREVPSNAMNPDLALQPMKTVVLWILSLLLNG